MNDEELAKFLHNEYEKISLETGWITQKSCQVGFDKLPNGNKMVMMILARKVLNEVRQETLKEVKRGLYKELKSNGSKNALNCVDEVIEELSKK